MEEREAQGLGARLASSESGERGAEHHHGPAASRGQPRDQFPDRDAGPLGVSLPDALGLGDGRHEIGPTGARIEREHGSDVRLPREPEVLGVRKEGIGLVGAAGNADRFAGGDEYEFRLECPGG